VNDQDKQNLFTRRAVIWGSIQGLLLSTVLGRLYSLQVLSRDHYQTLSDKNRIHTRLMAPLRGQITDRQGTLLATNHNTYRAIFIRDEAEDWRASLKDIAELLKIPEEELVKVQQEIQRKPRFMPVSIRENLSWEEVALVELHGSRISGISVDAGRNRYYPYAQETCHFVGYVAAPSDQDQTDEPLLTVPGFKLGKSGLEKTCESTLRGMPGIQQVEVNAVRKVVREISTTNSIPGKDLKLYLDLSLQQTVAARLSEQESACAIILDVKTGGVLAYVSHPGFDSNLFVNGIKKPDWQTLLHHPRHALLNKGIHGQYAPGSTFKMIVALAALEAGVINEHTSVFCGGHIALGNHKFHCHAWKRGGHGTVQLTSALAQSCDIYFYNIAAQLGIDPIAAMAHRFGLGVKTDIELPNEKIGLVPSRDWKSKVMGKQWTLGETYNASIGQGYLLTTPLQLTLMTARLASGKQVVPKFVCQDEMVGFTDLGIKEKHLELVRSGMIRVVNEPGATAYRARISQPGMEMAGKTGTTQVRRITEYERQTGLANSANRPWHHRDHAWFVAYAPIQSPRFATAVLVEHGVSGGKIAGPIARDILLSAQQIWQEI
jgi:penicillin-binding protein 2